MSGRKSCLPFFVAFVCLLSCSPALASSYFLWDSVPGSTWHDVDKLHSDPNDDYLCWAAAASNILDWGDWDTGADSNEALIFNEFEEHWTDQGSWPCYGMDWWLNGTLPPVRSGWSQVDVPGAGNYFPTHDFEDYYYEWIDPWGPGHDPASAYLVVGAIDYFLHQGYGMSIGIYTTGGGHALTVWGLEMTGSAYTGLYVTDSDDYIHALQYYPITWSDDTDWWKFADYTAYEDWIIAAVQALDTHPWLEPLPVLHPIEPMDTAFTIPVHPSMPVAPLVPPPPFTPVPAPPSLLLAILGLPAAAFARRLMPGLFA